MGQISMEGMRFRAFHGFYQEEGVLGNDFIIDIYINTNFGGAAAGDDLSKTINYETVYLICKAEMSNPVKLLETLAANIISALKHQFSTIQAVKIKVRKLNPIPGAEVASSGITQDAAFVSKCAKCGGGMVCYGDDSCWCQEVKVSDHMLRTLQKQYSGCLCKRCLSAYAG